MSLEIIIILISVVYILIVSLNKKQKYAMIRQSYIAKDCLNGNIDLVLENVDRNKRIIALKELRCILEQDLETCKYIIDNAPIVILKNISEEQAQYLQGKFNYMGINVSLKNNSR